MEFGKDDDENDSIAFIEISKMFETQNDFYMKYISIDRIQLISLPTPVVWLAHMVG